MDQAVTTGYEYIAKLKPGLRGEIVIDSGRNKGSYATFIEDVNDEKIKFQHPSTPNGPLGVYRDMDFTFSTEDSSALYLFEMTAVRSFMDGGRPCLSALITGEIKRIQRRSFLRIACKWDISAFMIQHDGASGLIDTWTPAKAEDISLRGMRFSIKRSDDEEDLGFVSGDKAILRFVLFEQEHYVIATATRVTADVDHQDVSVRFDTVPLSLEKKLFEYIREQELMGRDI